MNLSQIFFSFQGRISRGRFFKNYLLLLCIGYSISVILGYILPNYALTISNVITLLMIYPNLALAVKRFHDMDMDGIWFIYFYISYVVIIRATYMYPQKENIVYTGYALLCMVTIIILFLFFRPGTIGDNQYGKDMIVRDSDDKFQ